MGKIIGVGTDLIERERVGKACEKESFLNKCFTKREQVLLEKHMASLANNFAVKEAVAKCLGTGFAGVRLVEIEVLRDDRGAPFVELYGNARERAEELGIQHIYVSISDTDTLSLAFAVAEG